MCGIPFASMQGLLFASLLPARRNRRPRLWVAVVGFLLFAGLLAFFNVGRWLSVEDRLEKADAIAVLSGRMPDWALEAARIYQGGYAPEVWLTHSTEPGATLQKDESAERVPKSAETRVAELRSRLRQPNPGITAHRAPGAGVPLCHYYRC